MEQMNIFHFQELTPFALKDDIWNVIFFLPTKAGKAYEHGVYHFHVWKRYNVERRL